jgi:methionyl aminopeptidase
MLITLKKPREIEKIRKAGRILAAAFKHLQQQEAVRAGVTTGEIDTMVEKFIESQGGRPAFKGYRGFPKASCISLNEEVVHGIPSDRTLRPGDLVKIDIGVQFGGYHADSARTFFISLRSLRALRDTEVETDVGEPSAAARRLCAVTERALGIGIQAITVGARLTDISYAIQTHVEAHGYSVVRELGGHGIGVSLHEDPLVPNFGPPGTGPVLESGMVLAIEPMVNAGGSAVITRDNGWTIATKDGSLSAHFEDTVVATDCGTVNLTAGAA